MKRLIFLICLIALAFYAAWPAYSLYEIANGLKQSEEATIERKVAWGPLRESLKEPVTQRVTQEISNQSKGQGIEGVLAGELANKMAPQLVEKILDAYVTPKGVIMLANQGGKLNVSNLGIGKLVGSVGGGQNGDSGLLGGLLDKAKEIVGSVQEGKDLFSGALGKFGKDLAEIIDADSQKTQGSSEKTSYGLNNIKHFKFINPWSFEVGLAKSPTAKKPDVVAGMSFIDRDWKLSKIVPSF